MKVTVWPPGIEGDLPTRQDVRRAWAPFRAISHVQLAVRSARIQVSDAEDGYVECELSIANFSWRTFTPDRIDLRHWTVFGQSMPELPAKCRGLNWPIRRWRFGRVDIVITLNATAIRRVRAAAPQDPRIAVCDTWPMRFDGTLWFRESNRTMAIDSVVERPHVQVPWYLEAQASTE